MTCEGTHVIEPMPHRCATPLRLKSEHVAVSATTTCMHGHDHAWSDAARTWRLAWAGWLAGSKTPARRWDDLRRLRGPANKTATLEPCRATVDADEPARPIGSLPSSAGLMARDDAT